MNRTLVIVSALGLALLLAVCAVAQEARESTQSVAATIVTATVSSDRLRFAAPNRVAQLRLEVYSENGQKLFDTEQRGGNVLDWHLQDGTGAPLTDAAYLCLLTIKDLSGRLRQTLASVQVSAQTVTLQPILPGRLTTMQAQAVGPIEQDVVLKVIDPGAAEAATVIAHDGSEAQLTRTRGALTFRIGDFFSGNDKEQMRLTEGGNLGIGTTKPKVKLDVAGIIRAREGFMFSDGSTLNVNDKGVLTRTSADGTAPSVTTTQNQLAKFTDNAGAVGDSVVTELAGSIGIGTNAPTAKLDVLNGRIVTTGIQTLTDAQGIIEIGTTVTNNHNVASGIRMRNTFNGNATFQQALDVAPTFAPSASISLARGFISTAFFAPPAGVTITDAYGGNANTIYNNTGGAVTNGTGFAIRTPIVFGALKPTNQYGIHINNQGIGGTTNSYGLFVDAQTGSLNNYSAIFAGGNVGIGTPTPSQRFHIVQSGDYQVRIENPASGGGFWNIGQSDNSFHSSGGKLVFVPNSIESTNATVVFTNSGNVGIGTLFPTVAKLVVQDTSIGTAVSGTTSTNGSGVFGQSTGVGGYGVFGTNASGWGVYGTSAGFSYAGVAGVSTAQSGIGVYGKATEASGVGVIAESAQGFAIDVRGNAHQQRDKGGLVKAMLYISSGGNIHQCYNGLTGASASGISSPDGCGFHVTHDNIGVYNISFGFGVSDRFYALSAEHEFQGCTPDCSEERNKGANFNFFGDANSLQVVTFFTDQRLSITNGAFMLVVF